MARLTDVAKAAGVATSTASRVLSDAPEAVHISDRVKKLVLAAAHDLEYYGDPSARSLRTGKTHMIGLLGSGLHSGHLGNMIQAVETVLHGTGYHLITSTADLGSQEQDYSLKYFQNRVDGILLDQATWDRERGGAELVVRSRHVPIVLFQGQSDVEDVASVSMDDIAGGRLAGEHLLELGHREIAYLGGPPKNASSRGRLAGLEEAVSACPGANVHAVVGQDRKSCDDGYANAEAVLLAHPDITALFAFNDEVALGAMHRVMEMGRSVPDSFSVIGFDNDSWSGYSNPPLTTLQVVSSEVGRHAATLLLEAIGNHGKRMTKVRAPQVVIKPELIIRESTAQAVSQHLEKEAITR